jgi:hypothetical protein
MTIRYGNVESCAGFTVVELMVASLIAMTIAAAAFTLARQAQRILAVQPEQSDLQQRLRVGTDVLQQDLVMAGAGTYAGPARGPLGDVIATVMPYRAFGDSSDSSQGTFFRRDTISVLYVPSTTAQTTLAVPLPAGALDVQLAAPPNCPIATATQICGFAAGVRAVIVDAVGHWDAFTVDQVNAGVAMLRHRGVPSPVRYETGATVSEVRLATYSMKRDAVSGSFQLVRHDGWATELPVVDDVVALRFEYFGDPQPPLRTTLPLESPQGPWTTYGPKPPPMGETQGPWPAGENCTFLVVEGAHLPRLAVLPQGEDALTPLEDGRLTDGPWCPDAAAPNRFDADLLRVRRVRVTLRVQSPIASLRGPAGALFLNRGSARASDRYAPDLEVQFDVAPRNLNLGR